MASNNAEILQHRKACDLCLEEKCNEKCKHAHSYTYKQIEKAYDEAIAYIECRPETCPNCGRGCFDVDKFCPHCGTQMKGKKG